MLSYDMDEAIELLTDKLHTARKNLELAQADLDYLRDQITTMEVNTARVHNWDVKRRREQCVVYADPDATKRQQPVHSRYTLDDPVEVDFFRMWHRLTLIARPSAAATRAYAPAWSGYAVRHASGARARPERAAKNHARRPGSAPVRAVPTPKNWAREPSRTPPAPKAAPPKPSATPTASSKPKKAEQKRPSTPSLALPPVVSVFHLARMLHVHMRTYAPLTTGKLQFRMEKIGLDDTRPDRLLKFDDAALLAAEYNRVAVANEEAAFDIFPQPQATGEAYAALPLRPPVVTIMGHVDHGKTTLLDTLRSTTVAQGEAGGITQHMGAFSVPVKHAPGAIQSVTFLDTPGHAAFSMMRSRGTSVTDLVVLVVAADDSVMPQTREVIALVRDAERLVPMVVAITKIDAPNADPQKVRYDLMAEGVEVEDLGGDVPCVEVSAKKRIGLDTLEETLAILAEMADLRADPAGLPEGRVLESRVEKGRGNVATVLVQRGTLRPGDVLICGTTWAKVRQLLQPDGRATKQVLPGYAAQVAGWRELPQAGDEWLGVVDEGQCKRAVENRKRAREERALLQDAEQIDDERRRKAEADAQRVRDAQTARRQLSLLQRAEQAGTAEADAVAAAVRAERQSAESNGASSEPERRRLCVILKGDVSGTVEALAGAVGAIGNAQAGVHIVAQGVGDVTESDINTAHAVGAHVIGFHVQAPKNVQALAARVQPPVPVHCDRVIYQIMDHVTSCVAALLPPREEMRVLGEAQVAQLFQIKTGARQTKTIAGCRVTNGVVSRANEVRVLRGDDRREVFRGRLDTLRHIKKDVTEMRKGTECGMALDGFDQVEVGDVVQCFTTVEVAAALH